MDCAELNCFQVSGKSTRRTMIVRPMMARPQLQFGPSPSEAKAPLIVTRIQCSSRMSCLRTGTLYTGAHVRLAVLMLASFVARRHRVVATVAEGIAAQQAPRGQTEAALQVLPVVLQVRRGGAARARRSPRPRSGHVAPA